MIVLFTITVIKSWTIVHVIFMISTDDSFILLQLRFPVVPKDDDGGSVVKTTSSGDS